MSKNLSPAMINALRAATKGNITRDISGNAIKHRGARKSTCDALVRRGLAAWSPVGSLGDLQRDELTLTKSGREVLREVRRNA